RTPADAAPGAAGWAVAHAAGYGAWRAAPRGQVPDLTGVSTADARTLVRTSGWLSPAQATELLRCYGIRPGDLTSGPRAAVRVAGDRVFGPLVRLEAEDSYT